MMISWARSRHIRSQHLPLLSDVFSSILTTRVGESIVEYIAICARQLNTVSNYCKLLSEMIRNRLVCGITITKVQKWLLAKKQLSLDETVSLAQSKKLLNKGQSTSRWLLQRSPQPIMLLTFSRSMLEHQTNMMIKVHTSLNPVIIVVGNIHLTFVASNLNVVTFVVKLGT